MTGRRVPSNHVLEDKRHRALGESGAIGMTYLIRSGTKLQNPFLNSPNCFPSSGSSAVKILLLRPPVRRLFRMAGEEADHVDRPGSANTNPKAVGDQRPDPCGVAVQFRRQWNYLQLYTSVKLVKVLWV